MALTNGPTFPSTNPHNYTSNINLHAQGDRNTRLFNPGLSTIANNQLPLNTGYYNTHVTAYNAVFSTVPTEERDIKVATTGNLTIFNQVNQEVQENQVARGANMERNYGPNTIGRAAYVTQAYTYDVTKNTPNSQLFDKFFNTYAGAISSGFQKTSLQVVKIATLNANIRTATPFPNHFQQIPFPNSRNVLFLDFSSWAGLTTTQQGLLHDHLCALQRHYLDTATNTAWTYVVDMSNTYEGVTTNATGARGQISWNNGTSAPLIARILDDTLTRQDIRFSFFLVAKPLPRFYDNTTLLLSNGPNRPNLIAQLPYPDNREVYLKWLTKINYDTNEYTITGMMKDSVFALDLIRDVRICKTFLYQVGMYMHKVSFSPDSNVLFDSSRFENLLGGNLVGFGDYYTTCSNNTTSPWSGWIAWIPYELALSTNSSVNLDKVKWRKSQRGRQIADIAKRSRSMMVPSTNTTLTNTQWYNQNDKNANVNPLLIATNISNTARLTINAYPVSIYWETPQFPIFSTDNDEDYLVKAEYLEDHNFFPDYSIEESWN